MSNSTAIGRRSFLTGAAAAAAGMSMTACTAAAPGGAAMLGAVASEQPSEQA